MKTALLIMLFLVTTNPVLAGSTRFYRSPPSGITCETVRAYVSSTWFGTGESDGPGEWDHTVTGTESDAMPRERGLIYKRH